MIINGILTGIWTMIVFGYAHWRGYERGVKDTEKRWSDAVERTKVMTGRGLIPTDKTFEGPNKP